MMSTQEQSLLDAALQYAENGWRILPVTARGKAPLTPHGVKDASLLAPTVRNWWCRWPEANIGIAIPPGLVVVDIDSKGVVSQLRADGLDIPPTLMARTGRGIHLWYRANREVRSTVGIRPGVDLRASGTYVVAPPSVHSSGAIYRWKVPPKESNIASAPDWIYRGKHLSGAPASKKTARSTEEWNRTVGTPVLEGCRNQTLAEVAGLLFRNLPAAMAADLAHCWAMVRTKPPLPNEEVERTINSIAGRELRRRGLG